MFNEILEKPGFWILGGGGVAMEILGWTMGKKMGLGTFPIWQLIILIAVTIGAAAFFATRD